MSRDAHAPAKTHVRQCTLECVQSLLVRLYLSNAFISGKTPHYFALVASLIRIHGHVATPICMPVALIDWLGYTPPGVSLKVWQWVAGLQCRYCLTSYSLSVVSSDTCITV